MSSTADGTGAILAEVNVWTSSNRVAQKRPPTQMEPVMDHLQSLADRYVAVWNETDATRRRQQIAELWEREGQHYVGEREVRGHDALEIRIQESHEKNVKQGGNRFRAVQDARRLHDVVTFHWEMLPADSETVLGRGREFLIVNDEGQIRVDYMFFPA
jgi:hypothetical protein